MPGTFTIFHVLAFDLDDRKQPVKAVELRVGASVEAAVEAAKSFITACGRRRVEG